MKPTLTKFPSVDCNYYSIVLEGFNGRCAKVSAPSFLNISRNYFANEARHNFIGEATFFAMIVATAAVAVASGAVAVIELCRAFGAL
jgi:hypothetical protein